MPMLTSLSWLSLLEKSLMKDSYRSIWKGPEEGAATKASMVLVSWNHSLHAKE